MPKGTIIRLMDRGYGFIKTEEEEDLFFHRNEIEGVEFNSLKEGQEVEFEKGQGRDGRPQAVKVRLIETQVTETQVKEEVGDEVGDEGEGESDGGGDEGSGDEGSGDGDG